MRLRDAGRLMAMFMMAGMLLRWGMQRALVHENDAGEPELPIPPGAPLPDVPFSWADLQLIIGVRWRTFRAVSWLIVLRQPDGDVTMLGRSKKDLQRYLRFKQTTRAAYADLEDYVLHTVYNYPLRRQSESGKLVRTVGEPWVWRFPLYF